MKCDTCEEPAQFYVKLTLPPPGLPASAGVNVMAQLPLCPVHMDAVVADPQLAVARIGHMALRGQAMQMGQGAVDLSRTKATPAAIEPERKTK